MIGTLQPDKVKTADELGKFIRKCKVLLPNSKKTNFSTHSCFDIIEYTFQNHLKIHFHHHLEGSNKEFWKTLYVSVYVPKKKEYREAFRLSYPKREDDMFVYESFLNGYKRELTQPQDKYTVDGKNSIYTVTIRHYKLFIIRKNEEITHIGLLNAGILLKYYEIKGDKALYHFPITHTDDNTLSQKTIYFGFGGIAYILASFLYFQSIFMTFFIVAFAWGALAINDAVNPRRHPVLNILQAIIYAVIFFFIR